MRKLALAPFLLTLRRCYPFTVLTARAPRIHGSRPSMDYLGRGHVQRVLGTSLAWSELGEEHAGHGAEPLVLLHGVGDSHRTWRRVAPLLAKKYRLLLPDLPGHGLSGRPDAPYTLPWYAEVLHAWLDALNLPRVKLVGHSYGGGVAQWMLLERRERVSRLALVAPGGLGKSVSIGLRLPTVPLLGRALTPLLMGPGTRIIMRQAIPHCTPEDLAEIEQLAYLNTAPGSGRAFYRTLIGVIDVFGQTVQAAERIAEVSPLPPIGVFWGSRDTILPVGHAHDVKQRLQGATFHIYEGSGHCPQLDRAEELARDLTGFFEAPPRAPVPVLEEVVAGKLASLLGRLRARMRHAA